MSIVIETPDGPVNLLVDRIGEVIEGRPDLFEPPPESLGEPLRSLVEGVYKLEEGLLLVLNIDAVMRVTESVA
jgi:purine-binding chemotaxis protein CheW